MISAVTSDSKTIERVHVQKFLSALIDDELLFNVHISNLRKLKVKIASYFRNKFCFISYSKKLWNVILGQFPVYLCMYIAHIKLLDALVGKTAFSYYMQFGHEVIYNNLYLQMLLYIGEFKNIMTCGCLYV